ncbi:AMP-binding protein, partial [Methanobrevibacter sp.]|uniref:AMP-binding protein n=1 Tax=Methanobrevibacter sp. TaxID=66852 RepID=UPI00388D01A8
DISDYLNDVSDLILKSMTNSIYPFRLLAREFNLNNNVVFEYNYDLNDVSDVGNDIIFNDNLDTVSEFSCIVNDLDDGFVVHVNHLDKYSSDTIVRFLNAFKEILIQILDKEYLEDINYISDEDAKLLDSFNETEHLLNYNNVLDAFNDNLSKNPNDALVSFNNLSYSYAEGAFIAHEIAKKLTSLGVESQDCVGFLVPRGELYLLNILGIMSIGAVYVPLDDALPDERLDFMLKDSDCKVVIVNDETNDRVKESFGEFIILNISDILGDEIRLLSSLPAVHGNLACILYTSGTTGVPKGVKITGKSILNLSQFYVDNYDLSNGDVYGLFSTIGFDAALLATMVVLYSGASLSIVPNEIKLNINALNNYFIENNVTHTLITTQVGKLFMESVEDTSLEVLLVGGEKLGEFESPENYLLVDAFGPTEACVFISSIKNSDKIVSSSVGPLTYNTKAYILDNDGRRVPWGAVGELCLAGYQIADGYLNRKKETKDSFIYNPFDNREDYGILYHTGDMVRLLPDASLAIVGRRDSQVKIRGNRVELSEVEYVIRELDYVDDVTVQTIKNMGNYELVAYVAISDNVDEKALKDNVRDYVAKYKPDYMVPSYVMKLDKIPLNINSKVDKNALPEIDFTSLKTEYDAPTTQTEKEIIHVFESVFNQKYIGLNDDFINLGGDSITAIRVISLLERKSIFCTARDILNYKTPYLIAKNVKITDKISYESTVGEVDLLPIQSYFFNQINKDDFTQTFVLKTKTDLDLDILQKALDEVINTHDMLRAVYKFDDNSNPIQEILPLNNPIYTVNEYNISDNFEENIEKILIKSSDSINIKNKLIDVNLIHYNGDSYLTFVIHHLIVDGVSWSIIIDDLTHYYSKLKSEERYDIIRPYPYKNWVNDVKSLVLDISDDEKQYWIELNSLLEDTLINGESESFSFNVDATYDANNIFLMSEEEYLILAIARAYKKTYRQNIILNRESHGRDENMADVSKTVGWFTSQYPIKIKVNDKYDNISIVKDIYNVKTALSDVANLGLNYGSLVFDTLELEYKHCPVSFNFLSREFSFENELFKTLNLPISSNDYDIHSNDDSYGINFNIFNIKDNYVLSGDYAKNTYLGDNFESFVENIKSELEFIANFSFKDEIACSLSESQLGIYLDEKVHDKETAYSGPGIFICDANKSIDEIKEIIHILIDKHPILKGRILDDEDMPLLVCDSYPSIEIVETNDYDELIKPFDLEKNLARFFIVNNKDTKFIFYDIHHIINDATSRTIINSELKAISNNEFDRDVDLGFIYESEDSFEAKFKPEYESAQKFFSEEFADIDEVQSLLKDIGGNKGSVILPIRGIREQVESFAYENDITVSNLLNAVFAYSYSRFTGSEKVYFTFTEHGRHEDYSQNALGMFVRTIPIIVDCKDTSVNNYINNLSDLILKSLSNSFYPFRLLSNEFNLTNDITFEYNQDLNNMSNIGDEIIFSDNADAVSEFLCVVNDLDDGFVVNVNHLDGFSQNTAERFARAFKEILIQMLEKENLGDIDYISNQDIKLLDRYNETQHQFNHGDVLEAFNNNLMECENNALVGYKDSSYSHGEGAFIANEISNKLTNLGIDKQDYVVLFVNRSEWFLLASMGVLTCGAIYVPIETTYPDERIILMLKDTQSKVVIVDGDSEKHMIDIISQNNLDMDVLNVSCILDEDLGSLNHLNYVDVDENDTACVLYTSGTTGTPKGVLVSRKAVNNFVSWYVGETGFTSDDVYGMHCSYVFDIHTAALYAPLVSGGSLYVVPEDIRLDLKALNDYFVEHNCTHTYITSQVGKLFAESGMDTSIRLLCFGGMKLGELNAPDFMGPFETYGPSENLAVSTSIFANERIDDSSIGYFVSNVKGYVLDSERRRVPLGAVGELYLAGAQLTEGYLNRGDENSKVFFDN